jgi:hypothetical protein
MIKNIKEKIELIELRLRAENAEHSLGSLYSIKKELDAIWDDLLHIEGEDPKCISGEIKHICRAQVTLCVSIIVMEIASQSGLG